MKKKLGIYATYDKEGIVDEYIVFCLRELKKIVDYLIVVSNQKLTADTRQKIEFVDCIFERSDQGYDVGAFADVLTTRFGWNHVYEYDELVLMNDSVFGPFYSFDEILKKMDEKIDFWGLTTRGISDFDGGQEIYPEHIQLYFYVIKSRMLHSDAFREYWESIQEKITDFRSAIINYEFLFTKYFEERGFQWDVCIRLPGYYVNNPKVNLSPYHYNSYELIKSGKYPLIKRKLFTGEFVFSKYSDKADLRRAFEYIKNETEYDENLIWNYILKTYELGDIMESLCLYEEIEEDKFSVIETGDKKYAIYDLTSDKSCLLNTNCEIVLLFSLKRQKDEVESLYSARKFAVTENMMYSQTYIQKIIKFFEENTKVGALIPPLNVFGQFSALVDRQWSDGQVAEELYKRYNLHVPFSEDKAPVHKVDAVWCRREVFEKMKLISGWEAFGKTILQMIPLIAQQEGYYTEILQNKNYSKYNFANMQRCMRELWELLELKSGQNMNMEECENAIMRRKIIPFLKTHSCVYIYGAGERATRVLSMIGSREIQGIFVSDINGNAPYLCQYKVRSIEEFVGSAKNAAFIITVGQKYRKDIIEKLANKGIRDYVVV